MKKMWLILLVCIIFIPFSKATLIWTNDEVKVTSFREKVQLTKEIISGEETVTVNVIDIFSITIPNSYKHEIIFVSLTPPYGDFPGQLEKIYDVNLLSCEAGKHNLNYSLDKKFGLDCSETLPEKILQNFTVNSFNLIELNASILNWNEFLNTDGSKTVYFQVKYKMQDLVLQTQEYNTLLVRNIECHYNYSDCLQGSTASYISIPTYFFIEGGYNYYLLSINKKDEEMIFMAKNPEEDILISYTDTKKKNFTQIKWFMFGVVLSALISIFANKLTQEAPDRWILFFSWFFLFSLIGIGSTIFNYPINIAINIFLIFTAIIGIARFWKFLSKENGLKKIKRFIRKSFS